MFILILSPHLPQAGGRREYVFCSYLIYIVLNIVIAVWMRYYDIQKGGCMKKKNYKLDWTKINRESLTCFKGLLKIDTTNPPGNELKAIKFLDRILKKEGIKTKIIKTDKNRACIVARLKAGPGEKEPALILASHVDVVPHNPESWDLPAFAAREKDGFLYGRGAVDMKNMTVMSLMAVILIKRFGIELKRDVIFCATADEEAGSSYGMEYLVTKKPELFHGAAYALNEVGGFTLHNNGRRIYPIQTAEKGILWVKVELEGKPGHGSMPHGENPIVHMSHVLDRLYKKTRKLKVTPVASSFINVLCSTLPFFKARILKLIKNRLIGDIILRRAVPAGQQWAYLNAILHDTVSPNIIVSGEKSNVIPGKAEATLDCRLLPGTDIDSFLINLEEEIRKYTPLKVSLEVLGRGESATWNHDTELYRLIKRKTEEADPGSVVVPNLSTGFTDSKCLDPLGITCYGFTPVKIPEGMNFSELFHGHNERIPIKGFFWGNKLFFETVREFVERREKE